MTKNNNTSKNNDAKNNNAKKDKKQYFVAHSKLNKVQRKYCKCIMKIRPELKNIAKKSKTKKKITKNSPYGLCYYSIRKNMKLDGSPQKKQKFETKLRRRKLNCTMNYNYDAFSLEEVQKMAEDFDIPIKYTSKSNGKNKYFSKATLVGRLTNKYLNKKKKSKGE